MKIINQKWPPPPVSRSAAADAASSYAKLKLQMEKVKLHKEEINFFALEMTMRRVVSGKWSPRGMSNGLYGFLCDYGRSYGSPVIFLGLLIVLSAVLYVSHFGCELDGIGNSMLLSFSNSLSALGFRRDFFDARDLDAIPTWLKTFAMFQSVASIVLLFLFGLGLRNRFRLR